MHVCRKKLLMKKLTCIKNDHENLMNEHDKIKSKFKSIKK